MTRPALIVIALFFAGFLAMGFWAKDQTSTMPPIIKAVMDKDQAQLKAEIAAGVDVNVVGPFGITAMLVAVKQGSLETVKILMENGVDPNIKMGGMTLTELAENEKQPELVQYFQGLE